MEKDEVRIPVGVEAYCQDDSIGEFGAFLYVERSSLARLPEGDIWQKFQKREWYFSVPDADGFAFLLEKGNGCSIGHIIGPEVARELWENADSYEIALIEIPSDTFEQVQNSSV